MEKLVDATRNWDGLLTAAREALASRGHALSVRLEAALRLDQHEAAAAITDELRSVKTFDHALWEATRIREVVERLDDHVAETTHRAREYLKFLAESKLMLPIELPGIPGTEWRPELRATEQLLEAFEALMVVAVGVAYATDAVKKLREWNYDGAGTVVKSAEGEPLFRVIVRDGYQGPIA